MTVGLSSDGVLALLRSRRVVREFTAQSVDEDSLRAILEAGRWASSASNVRVHRFLVVRDPRRIRLVKAVSPGMLALPAALIVICTDLEAAAARQVRIDRDLTTWMDVGTAAMNMMVEAHALRLGTCPTTSFSKSAVRVMLELPEQATPELMLQVGHPATPLPERASGTSRWTRTHTYWEHWGLTR